MIEELLYGIFVFVFAFALGVHWERDQWEMGRREKNLKRMRERDEWLER